MMFRVALLVGAVTATPPDVDNIEMFEAAIKYCPKIPKAICALNPNAGLSMMCEVKDDKCQMKAALKVSMDALKAAGDLTKEPGKALVATNHLAWGNLVTGLVGRAVEACNLHVADAATHEACCKGTWAHSYNKCKGTQECKGANDPAGSKCHGCIYGLTAAKTKCNEVTGTYDTHIPSGVMVWNGALVGAFKCQVALKWNFKQNACGGRPKKTSAAARGSMATAAVVLASAAAALLI